MVNSSGAEKLAAKFAREVNVSGDGTSVGVEALQSKYEQLAVSLRDEHKARYGAGQFGIPQSKTDDNAFRWIAYRRWLTEEARRAGPA